MNYWVQNAKKPENSQKKYKKSLRNKFQVCQKLILLNTS